MFDVTRMYNFHTENEEEDAIKVPIALYSVADQKCRKPGAADY
jgi:hypothetical protein